MTTKKAIGFLNHLNDIIVSLFILTNGSILSARIEEFGIRHPDSVSHMLTMENHIPCRRVWITDADQDQAFIKNQVLNFLDSEACDSHNLELNEVQLQKNYEPEQNREILKKYYYAIRWTFRSFVHCSKCITAKKFAKDGHYHQLDLPNPSRYAKVYHQNIDDDLAERASKLKRRDFINQNEGFLAISVIVHKLCSHHNLSLVVLKNPNFHHFNNTVRQKYTTELDRSPTIRPRLFARTLSRLGASAFDVSSRYVRVNSIDFNFIYCSTPAVKVQNIWDLKIIFHAFKRNVWAALWFNLLIYAVILSKTYRLQDMLSAVFALFTSLLSGNANFGLKHLKRSVLFTVWMLTSMLLSDYFTGSMTSLLVKPLEEDVMTKLSHLVQRNYTLIFPAILPTVFQLVSVSVYGRVQSDYSERVNLPFQQTTDMGMLHKILGRNETYNKLGTGIFLQEIYYGARKATLGPWPYCMLIYNRVMGFIKIKQLSQKRKNRIVRHCHIGKELIPSGGLFWGFFPPSNQKLMETFQTFQEAGIHSYWITEFYGMGFANKVQERSKIKSPTSIAVEEKENSFSSMKLNEVPQEEMSKTLSVFSKKRNYYNKPPFFGPIFVLANLHSSALNTTLLMKREAIERGIVTECYPTFMPAIQVFDTKERTVQSVWDNYRQLGTARLGRLKNEGYNFVYCDSPKIVKDSWDFIIFTRGFDTLVWVCIVIAFLAASFILTFYPHRHECRFDLLHITTSLFASAISLLSVLISSGPSFAKADLARSNLFCMWTFICLVLVNYYTGLITSQLISPPLEDVMKKMSDLLKRNYTLIFHDITHLDILNATVQQYQTEHRYFLGIIQIVHNS
ncbi:unnamed protein product [Orchesella dallaii]|uniref:Ionotropic glutamate receptor C-terminal domain-containing protein n=1 Tax=Orchesella dallaii TaxID=48710 RepID=A0ABP1RE52_9HEXA